MNAEKKIVLKMLAELEVFRMKIERRVIPAGSAEWAIKNCQDIIENMTMNQDKDIGLAILEELGSYRKGIEARALQGTADHAIHICQAKIAKGHFETRIQWSDILRRDRNNRMIEIITQQLSDKESLDTGELYSACEEELGAELDSFLFSGVITQLMNEGHIVRENYLSSRIIRVH
jgi:hypothetical protein